MKLYNSLITLFMALALVACASEDSDGSAMVGGGSGGSDGGGDSGASGGTVEPCAGAACIVDFDISTDRSCAVRGDGRVYCWGLDIRGKLGVGGLETSSVFEPLPVLGVGGTGTLDDARAVAVDAGYSCAVRDSGRVVCWGNLAYGKLGREDLSTTSPIEMEGIEDAQQLALGSDHACVLLGDRTVRCWGRNGLGQLGNGAHDSEVCEDAACLSALSTVVGTEGGQLEGVVKVGAAKSNACALLDSGEVVCWGAAANGKLGTADSSGVSECMGGRCSATPVRVSGIEDASDLSVGWGGICAVLSSGEQRCWGTITQLAGAEPEDTERATLARDPIATLNEAGSAPLTGIAQTAIDAEHACVVMRDGRVMCWGNDVNQETGRLRNGGADSDSSPGLPGYVTDELQASQLRDVVRVDVGFDHTCALKASGELMCWGALDAAGVGRGGDGCGGGCAKSPRSVSLP